MKVLAVLVVGILALIGVLAIAAIVWFKFKFAAEVNKRQAKRAEEETIVEVAEWIGKSGLDEATERELPRYLRRELGEMLQDEGSLQAADLVYLGGCIQDGNKVHYWYMPYGKEEVYAYVDVDPSGQWSMGWSGRLPPDDFRARAREIREAKTPVVV